MTATITEFDELVATMVGMQIPREKAEAAARAKLGISGSGADVPVVNERDLEKAIEHAGDQLMRGFGFEVVRFSQPRATKQTPGIADRRYYRRPRLVERRDGRFHQPAVMCWWEAKSPTGEQTPDERNFQELVEACGEPYVLGTTDALVVWLVAQRIAVRVAGVLEPVTHEES